MKKLLLIASLCTVVAGCASNQSHTDQAAVTQTVNETQTTDVTQANYSDSDMKEGNGFFDDISMKMSDYEVESLIGSPDHVKAYSTGKRWIPFYFGTDTSRVEWQYKNVGYITFTRNRYSRNLSVIKVVYDDDI